MVWFFGLARTSVVRDIRGVEVVRVSPFRYSDSLVILGDTATAVSLSELPGVVRFKAGVVEECAYDVFAPCVLGRELFQYRLQFGFLHRPAIGRNMYSTESIVGREGRVDEQPFRCAVNITDSAAVSVLKRTAALSARNCCQHEADKRSSWNFQLYPVHGQHSTTNLC